MSELDGMWVCESATVNGRKLDEATAKSLKLTLNGAQYKTESNYGVLFDSTYTADTSADPPQMDIVGVGELAGRVAKGIYDLSADRLTLCYTPPGKERPTAFESKEGSEAQLTIWRRAE